MNNIENIFVPYQIALDMKSIGFDEPCFGYYENGDLTYGQLNEIGKRRYLQTPTYSQAFRWFRDTHKLHATITSISQESWQWHIQEPGQKLGELYNEDYYYYEEAELECLKKLIEIVKNK
jgi:hypothetical protein